MRRRAVAARPARPSLVGTMARTAVISGTATAVSGKVAQSQMAKAQAAQAAPAQAAPEAPKVAGGLSDRAIEQLKQLAELRDAGILTTEEFDAKKASILGL